MITPPICQLHLIFARAAPKVAILRRGPSKWVRLILWDRETDAFEDGQWFHGRIYEDRCDISPDGRHFLYFALDGRWQRETMGAWTAISRPPWLTALALYPEGNTWGGGGRFVGNSHFTLCGCLEPRDLIGKAPDLAPVEERRDAPEGGPRYFRIGGPPVRFAAEDIPFLAREDQTALQAQYPTEGGRLYRETPAGRVLIRDFSEMRFEPMRAPYDDREEAPPPEAPSPEAPPWHPLDGEAER